ncbi:MAG: hypothetical protein J3Q66DRAFT_407668 [Benniella sp.]|nr:MAG: hypothetical protein J3Q66DRAFT_407668 [Benniella sp.]
MDFINLAPFLVDLKLVNVSTKPAFWEALSEHHHLKILTLCDMLLTYTTPSLWKTCMNLESLRVDFVSIKDTGHPRNVASGKNKSRLTKAPSAKPQDRQCRQPQGIRYESLEFMKLKSGRLVEKVLMDTSLSEHATFNLGNPGSTNNDLVEGTFRNWRRQYKKTSSPFVYSGLNAVRWAHRSWPILLEFLEELEGIFKAKRMTLLKFAQRAFKASHGSYKSTGDTGDRGRGGIASQKTGYGNMHPCLQGLIQDLTLDKKIGGFNKYQYPNMRRLVIDMNESKPHHSQLSMNLTKEAPMLVDLALAGGRSTGEEPVRQLG